MSNLHHKAAHLDIQALTCPHDQTCHLFSFHSNNTQRGPHAALYYTSTVFSMLPAGPADRFLQMCYAPIGLLKSFSYWPHLTASHISILKRKKALRIMGGVDPLVSGVTVHLPASW